MYHSVVPYDYVNRSYRSLGKGPLLLCHEYRSSPALEAWVFVSGRSRACWLCWQEGVEMFSSCLQDWASFFVGKPIHVTICFVCNRQCISSSLGYDLFQLYHGLIPYVCVSSSYRRLSKAPLHSCHGQRSPSALEAWVFVGGRSRARSSWWLEGVEVISSRMCIIRYLLCSENPFISPFVLSVTVIVFPYG